MTVTSNAAADFVSSVNDGDAERFMALFAADAVVDDNGRTFRGSDAIREWSDREIFAVNVTLEPVRTFDEGGDVVVRTKVDGDFDRTGLPDPLFIDQRIATTGDKIVSLTCRLAAD